MKIILSLCLVTVSLLLLGCTKNRNLKVTEVLEDRVEIFLDEASNQQLALYGIKLKWVTKDGPAAAVAGELDLSVWSDALLGQQFLVIFEDPTYMGPPVAQPVLRTRPGIKVSAGFFPDYRSTISVSMSVAGTNNQGLSFLTLYRHVANDLVRFGPSPRPPLAGTFLEDGTLNDDWPQGDQSKSVSRAFSGTTPLDTDSESDWSLRDQSDGFATPPPPSPTPSPTP